MPAERTFDLGADRCDASCLRPSAPAASMRHQSHRAMGTEFTAYIDVPGEVEAQACFQCVFEEIDRIEQTFSRG